MPDSKLARTSKEISQELRTFLRAAMVPTQSVFAERILDELETALADPERKDA